MDLCHERFFLLSLSLLISCIIPFAKADAARLLFVLLHLGIIVLTGYPSDRLIAIDPVLMLNMVSNAILLQNRLLGLIASAAGICSYSLVIYFVTSSIQQVAVAFDKNIFAIILILIAYAIALERFRRYRMSQIELHGEISRLSMAISNLMSANIEYQANVERIEHQSVINERNRISHEIHDTLGYMITNILMMLQACSALAPKRNIKLGETLRKAIEEAQNGYKEARKSLYRLQAIYLGENSYGDAISSLVAHFKEATGLNVTLDYGNSPIYLIEKIGATLYRTIQESLTNSLTHGKARKISIRLWIHEENLIILIKDDGVGSKKFAKGLGLRGMTERIRMLGGAIQAGDAIEGGFQIAIYIPIGEMLRN